jgi:ATP-binding cassette, subfamily B, bacterial
MHLIIHPFRYLYPRVVAVMWRANGWKLVVVFALSVLSAITAPLQIFIMATAIDQIVRAVSAGTQAVAPSEIMMPLAAFAGIWLIGEIATTMEGGLRQVMTERTLYQCRYEMADKSRRFDVAFFDSGKQAGRLQLISDESWRLSSSTYTFISIVSQLIAGMALLVLMATINPIVPLILLVLVMPRVVVRTYFSHKEYDYNQKKIESQQLARHTFRLLTQQYSAKEVKLFGLGDFLIAQYRALSETYLKGSQSLIFKRERAMFLVGLLSILGTVISWGVAISQAAAGKITAGGLAAVFQSVQQLGNTFDRLFDELGFLFSNNPFLKDYFDFMDMPPENIEGGLPKPPSGVNPLTVPRPIARGLRFENVSFVYPESDKLVLDGVSFEIGPGESLAIVGENGAGKSTLSKLLAGLYSPTAGAITLDGQDMKHYDRADYFANVSAVFQDFPHIHFSARDNIAFGDITFFDDMQRIKKAANLGGATQMIEALPHGFDTLLGKSLERGVDLSGGQWQRIALARAFMRDAQILITDEPSAALDPIAERDLFQRFAELTKGKMSVLISHRLASCRMADRILVLEHGKIIEEGNHQALMRKKGRYHEMFEAQASSYV